MKSKKILALTVIFAMLLCFTSCGSTDTEIEDPGVPVEPDYSNVVATMYSEEGSFEDLDGNKWEYSYVLPEINLEDEEAQKINTEIKEAFGKDVEAQLEYISNSEIPEVLSMDYESYVDSDMLSLVIRKANLWGEYDYMVFNYDLLENKRMTYQDVIKKLGYDESQIDENIRKAAVREYDISHAGYYEEYFDPYTLERRVFTEVNYSISKDYIYNGGGHLRSIVLLGSLAGSDTRSADVPIPNEYPVDEGAPEQTNYDFVWAKLTEDNQVYIAFELTPESGKYLDESFVEYGEYRVEGCVSKYKKILLGSVGESMQDLYLFLLTEEGHVEYVDVMYGFVKCGTLCNGGPLSGVKNVVDLEKGTAKNSIGGEYETVFAITSDGEKIDLMEHLYEAQTSMLSYLDGTMVGESGHERIYLDFKVNTGEISIGKEQYDDGISERYTGSVRVLGMSDTGLCYALGMYNEKTKETTLGCVEIPYGLETVYDYEHYYFKWRSGTNIFGTDDAVKFNRSYG